MLQSYSQVISKLLFTIKCVNFVNPVFLFFTTEVSLVNKIDLQALNLSRTYCHKNGTRTPRCVTPWQLTIYSVNSALWSFSVLRFSLMVNSSVIKFFFVFFGHLVSAYRNSSVFGALVSVLGRRLVWSTSLFSRDIKNKFFVARI